MEGRLEVKDVSEIDVLQVNGTSINKVLSFKFQYCSFFRTSLARVIKVTKNFWPNESKVGWKFVKPTFTLGNLNLQASHMPDTRV